MATRAAGTYNFGPVTVPTGVRGATAAMDVSQAADPLPTLTAILEGSLDGGSTWMSAGAFTRPVGNRGTNLAGAATTTVAVTVRGGPFWDDAANANSRLRGIAPLGGLVGFFLGGLRGLL